MNATSLSALEDFPTVGLDQITDIALLKRIEKKYLIPYHALPQFLASIQKKFHLLMIDGSLTQRYLNNYYDSHNFSSYRAHHSGARPRYKIRVRKYLDSGISFVEVKHKVKPMLTYKYRQSFNKRDWRSFIQQHTPKSLNHFNSVLENHFQRISLVDIQRGERFSIDLNITSKIPGTTRQVAFPIAVVEYKYAMGARPDRHFEKLCHRFGMSSPFSKYCLSCGIMIPELKSNAFKPVLRKIKRIADYDV